MSFPDEGTEFGDRVRRRLRDDMIAWLTTVDGAGTPQPSPVWFLWDADARTALIYCQPAARRLARLPENDRASLNLGDGGEGHDVVVLTGAIERSPGVEPADANAAFVAKYGAWMDTIFGSAGAYAAAFSEPVTFRTRRVRGN